MKLHLPKGLRSAVLACMAVVGGLTTTVGTGFIAGGALTIAFAGAQVSATEYTNPENLADITFAAGDVLNLGDGQTVSAPLTLDSADSSITLNVTGGTVTWATSQGENKGVSSLVVKTGATLNVTSDDSRNCVFASKAGGDVNISLETGAKMNSLNLFGWENTTRGEAARVVNMAADSLWTIKAGSSGSTDFYLNNTTIKLSGGKITLEENTVMWFERRTNSIRTTAEATKMSVIDGAGVIKAGNNGNESGGYIFDVVRGNFEINATNTADLRLSAALVNADAAHGVQKTGDGVMELTANNTLTHSFFVRAGEVKVTGDGNLASSNTSVESGATLTLNTTATFAGVINLQEGGVLSFGADQKLGANASLLGTVAFNNAVTLSAGAVTFGENTIIDLTGWDGGDTYQLFNVEGGSLATTSVKVVGASGATGSISADGVLTLTELLNWSSGTSLTWKEGAEFDDGSKFSNNAMVQFAADLGDVTATMEGSIVTSNLAIGTGTNLVVTGEGTLTSYVTKVEGDLTMGSAGHNLGTLTMGSESVLTIATGTENTLAEVIGGDGSITGGSVLIDGDTTLSINGGRLNGLSVTIAEGSTLNAASCSLSGNLTIQGTLNVGSGDFINYNATNQTITIDGGSLVLGENRVTVGGGNKLILNNGTITGAGDQHGAVDFFTNGGVVTSSGNSKIDAPIRLRTDGNITTMNVVDGVLTVTSVVNKGSGASGDMSKTGAGTLLIDGSVDTAGVVSVVEGDVKLAEGATVNSSLSLAGGSLSTSATATAANVSGSGDIKVDASGSLTLTNASGLFNKLGAGTLTIGTMGGDALGMNYEGTLTIETLALAENAVLSYGNIEGGKLLKIDSLSSKVSLNIFALQSELSSGINLGIASSVSKDLISVVGLDADEYQLKSEGGYWTLTSSATEFHSDWDMNWGANEIATAPVVLTEVAITGGESGTNTALVGSAADQNGKVGALLTGGGANTFVFAGANEDAHTGDVWVAAKEGEYKLIVGGNNANNWDRGNRADFTGDTHILIDGATVGTIIGGSYKDGQNPLFTGNTYISVYSGDVTASIIGGTTNGHGMVTTFTGNTNVFIYTPLTTGNTNGLGGATPVDSIVGGCASVDPQSGRGCTNTLNGTANVTIDLSGVTLAEDAETSAKTFVKGIIGGSCNATGANMTSSVTASNVTITGSSSFIFSKYVVGGSYATAGTHTVGTSTLTIDSGHFSGVVTGGVYSAGGTMTVEDATLAISGGTFDTTVAGGSYQNSRAVTTVSGSSTLTATDATFAGWVVGGVFANSGSSQATVGDVVMSLTDSTFAQEVVGGAFLGGGGSSATVGDVNITLDGVSLNGELYGGVYHYAGSSSSTVGDVTINLTGDGTISGSIWAAGRAKDQNAGITVASTTVNVADTVTFAEGASINGGLKLVDNATNGVVTGDRALVFTGASQDRSGLSFSGFNVIGVEKSGATATVAGLTMDEALTITGKGTLKLAGAATFTSGVTVDGALDMAGQEVTGNVTVNGTLTSGGTVIAGDLTLGTGAKLTDAAAASNINVETFTNTKGLTATGDIVVTDSLTSSSAITAGKISGSGDVTITGGTVTLTDTTDAFANSGTTTITGATLAGTWTAAGVTVGGVTIGTGADITIDGGTISTTVTNDGSLTLTGTINVGVTAVPGDTLYTHGATTATDGNGYRSTTGYYTIANGTGTLDVSGADWAVEGVGSGTGSYADGVLTFVSDADTSAYWVNTGSVEYGDNTITYDGESVTLATGTTIKLNGGELILSGNLGDTTIDTTDSVDSDQPSSVKIGDDVVLSKDSLVTAFGNGAELGGTGTYDIGNVPSLGDGVTLSDAWVGTVQMGDVVADGSLDISALGNASSTVKADSLSAGSISGADINLDVTMPAGGLMAPMGGGLAEGTVELTDGASSLSSLKVNTLILGTDSTVATLDVTKLDINGSLTVNNLGDGATTLITTDKLIGSFDVNLDLELLSSVKTGTTMTLLTSTNFGAATVGKFNGSSAWDFLNEADMRMYSLGWDNGELTISVKNPGSPWKGEFWLNNDLAAGYGMNAGDYWDSGVAPDAANPGINEKDALFDGGTQDVIIGGIVTPRHVIVEREDRGSSAYYFQNVVYEDGSIEDGIIEAAGGLYLREGTVMMDNTSSSFAENSSIGAAGKLVVGSGGAADSLASATFSNGLTSEGSLTVGYNGNLTVENGMLNQGEMTVKGGTATLSGSEGVYGLENEGSLSVVDSGTLNVRDTLLNEGSITVNEGTINVDSGDLLNYGDLTVTDGTVNVAQGDLSNSHSISLTDSTLNVEVGILYNNELSATDSTITVGDSVVNSGSISLEGGSISVTNSIESIDSNTIDLNAASLQAGSVTMADGDLTATDSILSVDGEISSTGTGSIILENSTAEVGSASTAGSVVINDSTLLVDTDMTATGGLALNGGTLSVNGDLAAGSSDMTVDANSTVSVGGEMITSDLALSVEGGVVDVTGGMTATDGSIDLSSGSLTVGGDLAVYDGTLSVNGGDLVVEGDLINPSDTLDITGGSVMVTGSLQSNLDTLAAGALLSVGTYEDTDSLNVAGNLIITDKGSSIATLTTSGAGAIGLTEGAKLTLTDDSNIYIGDNAGEIDAMGTTLKLTSATTGAGNLKATALDITTAAGTVAGDIKVSEIIFGSLEAGDTAPALTIDSYSAAGSEPILVVLGGNPAESIAKGNYLLMSSGSALVAGDFSLSDEYEQTVLKRGDIIELTNTAYQRGTESSLYAVVRGQTDAELTWNTSSADSVGGLHITDAAVDSSLMDGYATLDTIRNINVDEDQTISLVGVDRDDETDSLMLRNVNGAAALSLVGDSAADDHATITSGDLAELNLENITALIGTDGTFIVDTLSGNKGSVISGSVTVTDSAVYSGGYDSAVIVGQDAAMELASAKGLTVQSTGGTVKLNGASGATIDGLQTSGTAVTLIGSDKGMTAPLTLLNPSSMKGGKLSFTIDPVANLGGKVISGKLNLNGTNVAVTQANKNKVLNITPGVGATIIADLGNTTATATTVTLNGVAFDKYFVNARVEDGCVVADRNMTYAEGLIQTESVNGAAGVAILSDALVNINPQADREQYPDLAALLDAVDEGRMTDADAAAVAGSSIASLGMALSGDVERQLRAIRNRTTAMGVNECVVNEGMPYFNAWVNAEGNRAELDKDGTMAGYTLDSWGGTVGFDADINPHFTAGLAITAMYGDLKVDGPDSAEGDMDTYYVSLFARYAKSAWTHTFVATLGLMDGSLARTVNAAGVNYETDGSTDGMTFGLMYEVGYVMPLDEDATACLQPVFNVMLRHTSVGSYTESGSDAALDADSQSLTTVTFGIGARLQAVVGESLYNRASIFEARALAKLDAGDRQSDVDVALPGGRATANVQSAELGAFGVELGAGLTIPVGDDDGSVFIDASLELRSGYSNVNGTVGYRINF